MVPLLARNASDGRADVKCSGSARTGRLATGFPANLTRSPGGSGFGDALAEAGFGETTRGAVALVEDTAQGGPAPAILQLDLRTVAGE